MVKLIVWINCFIIILPHVLCSINFQLKLIQMLKLKDICGWMAAFSSFLCTSRILLSRTHAEGKMQSRQCLHPPNKLGFISWTLRIPDWEESTHRFLAQPPTRHDKCVCTWRRTGLWRSIKYTDTRQPPALGEGHEDGGSASMSCQSLLKPFGTGSCFSLSSFPFCAPLRTELRERKKKNREEFNLMHLPSIDGGNGLCNAGVELMLKNSL